MEGVPGLAKTLAVKSLARICGLGFQRVQCTADLMPSDVTGTNVFDMSNIHVQPAARAGVHRPSPGGRDQSHLAAHASRAAGSDGGAAGHHRRRAPSAAGNFTVFATQNPIEFEGTYPLPEAQLDRFLLKIVVPYPTAADETEILSRYEAGFDPRKLEDIRLEPFPAMLLDAAPA